MSLNPITIAADKYRNRLIRIFDDRFELLGKCTAYHVYQEAKKRAMQDPDLEGLAEAIEEMLKEEKLGPLVYCPREERGLCNDSKILDDYARDIIDACILSDKQNEYQFRYTDN